jgi:hypothetical protein
MFTVSADFIGDFKVGDNICHNCEILNQLYASYMRGETLLLKPMIVTIASIAEAVLYDFHMRIKDYVREGVQGINEKTLEKIRNKQIDQFETYIASARKNQLLGPKTADVYTELDNLRKLRNRIHIQNLRDDFEADENQAFSEVRLQQAEKSLEKLIKTISTKHPRKGTATGYVQPLELPWTAHFDEHGN